MTVSRPLIGGIVLALSLVTITPVTAAHEHDHGGDPPVRGRIGVLIADHGEPPEYNELTYWSFRKFFDHLIEMGLIPSWLKLVDNGTVLQDAGCYGCETPRERPELIDAWLRPHDGPAVFVPGSESLPAHYEVPGGPGLGEPDIFEHVGLGAWHEWQLMGGRSPNYDQKLEKKREVLARLKRLYGESIPIRVGYGIDPRIGGGYRGFRKAVTGLINRERVKHIVVAYHGVGFSDIMQTHMIRHRIHELVEELDAGVTVSYADPIGVTHAYVRAVAAKVRRELDRLPDRASVAVHLSDHGLPTAMCGDYDCGADAYHAFARKLFQRTKRAIVANIDRPGRTRVFQIYGDGGSGDDDPDDEVDSPIEALDKRAAGDFKFVVDVPYSFDSDSRDTLIVLRRGYRRSIPDWNRHLESSFRYNGMSVKITNASFGAAAKTDAFELVIRRAIGAARSGG